MQDVDRIANVEALSKPARLRCLWVDLNPLGLVSRAERPDGIGGDRGQRRALSQELAVGAPEAQLSVALSLDLKAFFVHRAVVPTAEHREVGQCRRAAVGPVADVMPLAEQASAAREAAAVIAMLKRAP